MKSFLYFLLGLLVFSMGDVFADASILTGNVTNFLTGDIISGATVELQFSGRTIGTSTSDVNGNYSFKNRDHGTYTLVCSKSGFQTVTTTIVIEKTDAIVTCNFQLVPLGRISGMITNSATGLAISGATVQMLQNNSVVSSTTTDITGTYSLIGLAPGSYTLSVSAALFQAGTAAVTITSSNTTQNLALQPLPGNITGTVISSITSLGLSGATLTFSTGGIQVASTTSGALGAYTVTGLPAGTYSISVNLAGYQAGTGTASITSTNTTNFNISLVPLSGTLSGTVRNATTGSTLSGAVITVLQGSTVIGTATSGSQGTFTLNLSPGNYTVTTALTNYQTLSSSVTIVSSQTTTLNPSLQPLPGNVSGLITNSQTSAALAGATVSIFSGSTLVASTVTNASGSYAITGLAPGTYTLTASLNNFVATSQSITISSNATLTQNAALTPQMGTVTGIIQDTSFNPLGGASVVLMQGSTVVATTTVAPLTGVYSFNVLPGSYTISASATNYTTASTAANILSNSTSIVNITLVESPGSVSGLVRDAVTLSALNGATVQVLQGSLSIATTVTNSSGNYSMTGIAPGNYTLSVSLANYVTGTTSISVASNQTTTTTTSMQPQNGSVSGVVKDLIGLLPIQDAAVSLYQGFTLVASTTTDTSGNYVLPLLTPGSYTLSISSTNYQTATQAITIQSNTTSTANLNLQPLPGSASGSVINAQTTLPLSGTTITLLQGSTPVATTVTNSLGDYVFTGLLPGSYTITASSTNFISASQTISINPNAATTQNFSLQPQSGTLSGQVTSSLTTAFLNNVTIQVMQGASLVATTTTSENGNYSFTLAPGSYTIIANLTDYQTLSQPAAVQPNVAITSNFSLTPIPGNINGTVTSASTSLPLNGVTVTVKQGQTTIATAQTSVTGAYTVSNLSPSTYSVVFSLNNYQTSTQTSIVSSNATTETDAALSLQPGDVTGFITNALSSLPINGVTVTAMQGATVVSTTTTAFNGSYQLSSLPPGTYTISAVATDFQTASQASVAVSPNASTAVNISLQPQPGIVSGFITDSVSTSPIQNATILVTQNGVTIASTSSSANGAYSIENLVPDTYILVASAANYQGTSLAITVNSNATTTASTALQPSPGAIAGIVTNSLTSTPISNATVEVLSGSTVLGLMTTAADGTYTLSGLAPAASGVYTFRASAPNFQTATSTAAITANTTTTISFVLVPQPGSISGTITNAQNGSGIASTNIQVLQGSTVISSTLANANGVYTVSGLAPGSYTVSASASNFQSNAQSSSVSANATTTVNLALQPSPGSLSGLITDSATASPLVGATVAVWNQSALVASTLTLDDGTYSITELAPGTYTIVISKSIYQNTSVSATLFANQTTTLNQSLQALPGVISGTVMSGASPLAGATITLAQGSNILATLTTDNSGSYISSGLAPGSYIVTASAPTYQMATNGAIVTANTTTTVNFNLILDPGMISGSVKDATTQLPLQNALVTVLNGNVTLASTFTASDGSYTIAGLAPGSYSVVITSLNYQTTMQGAIVHALETTTVNGDLQPEPGSLSGQITDFVTLNGISGSTVAILQNNVLVTSTLTDANGFYSTSGLTPGAYSVTVYATNYQNSVKGAIIVANANSSLNVALQSLPGIITGQVVDTSSPFNPLNGSFVSLFSNHVLLQTQVADAQGNFSFANLAPGNYSVLAQLANYQTATQAVMVTANATNTITLTLQAAPGSNECRVLDATTLASIVGANVSILQGNVIVAMGITDATGSVNFSGLAPGSYLIRATDAHYQSLVQGMIIQSNQTTLVSLSLQPDPGAISGTVTDSMSGGALSGVTVELVQGGVTLASVLTDSNGAYVVNALSPGQYFVRVFAKNYQTYLQVASIQSDQTATLNVGLVPSPGNIAIALTDSATSNAISGATISIYNPFSNVFIASATTDAAGNSLTYGLSPGTYNAVITADNYQSLSLSVIVAADATTSLTLSLVADPGSISCLVTDSASSEPLSGCLVEALKGSIVIGSGLTDTSGICQLANLAPGSYTVRASLADYQTATQTTIVALNAQTSLQMHLTSQPGNLAGTVLDALTSLPLGGAQLSLFSGQILLATTASDALGNYLFTGLPPGVYTLRIGLLNYETLSVTVTIVANQTTQRNNLLSSQPGNLSGTVLDATTTLPVVGADISILNGSTVVANVLTDSSGNYSATGLTVGVSYTVVASATNYQVVIQGATVQSNQTTTVNFNLNAQPGSIIGQVTDSSTSSALVGATVDLLQNSVLIASTQTDSLGNYQIGGLSPGSSYTLRVGKNLYQTKLVAVSVQANQITTVSVALQVSPGSIQGTLVDAQTAALLPNAQVQVFAGSNLVASTLADESGAYLITGIAPGQYSVTAILPNYQTGVETALVQSNATATVNFSLQPNPGSVIGTVLATAAGNPIIGANVSIYQGSNILASSLTDSNGAYLMSNLAPGHYTLVVSANLFQNASQGATVTSNQTTTANFTLADLPGSITGTITGAAATVDLLQGQNLIASTATTSDGSFSFSNLSPGNYTVRAQAQNFQTALVGASVLANMTTNVSVTLQAQTGTLTGQVVDAVTTNPLANVTVEVMQNAIVIDSTLTSASGNYSISNLAPGTYTVRATLNTYQIAILGATVQPNVLNQANFSLNLLPGSIAGQVTDAASGTLLPEAQIDVLQGTTILASLLTDSNGSYLISNLSPGSYTVRATLLNYETSLQAANVTATNTTSVNFTLTQEPGSVQGQITDAATGLPITTASVVVHVLQSNILLGSALTDSNGNYLISGLPQGSYTLQTAASMYQTAVQGINILANRVTTANAALQPEPGSIAGVITDQATSQPISGAAVDIMQESNLLASLLTDHNGAYLASQLAPGRYTVRVQATNYQTNFQSAIVQASATTQVNSALQSQPGSLSGNVSDTTSTPLVGALIIIKSGNTLVNTVLTDAFGNYVINGLPPGTYTVFASATNTQATFGVVTISANMTSQLSFNLVPQPGSVSGQIIDAGTLQPISAATVDLLQNSVVVASLLTDAQGNYTLNGLTPSQYTLRAAANNYGSASVGVEIISNTAATVNISLTSLPGTVSGTITDSLTTLPIPSATIQIYQGTTLISSGLSDANGAYSLQGLKGGNYNILVTAVNYQNETQGVSVQANQTAVVNMALLAEPATLIGTVVDALTQTPLVQASVQVFKGSTLVSSGFTDGNGLFTLSGLNPGTYILNVFATNYQSSTTTFSVMANQTLAITIALGSDPGTLSGSVFDSTNMTPITGASVSILQGSLPITSLLTDSKGAWTVPNLQPGSYTVVVAANTYQTSLIGALVQANSSTAVTTMLVLQPGGVSGQVTSDLAPLAGATVDVLQDATVIATSLTDSSGNYSINSLAPGSYTIRAGKSIFNTIVQGLVITAGTTTTADFSLKSNPGSITGTVTDASTSQPVRGATLLVTDGGALVASALTDANGQYQIDQLNPGSYTITTSSITYQTGSQGVSVSSSQITIVDFALQNQPGMIAGQIVDQSTGLSLAGATITVSNGSNVLGTMLSDSNGNYVMNGLMPGSYTVRAALNTYQTTLQSAIVTAAATTTVNFSLIPDPGSVSGQVTNTSGELVTGASVAIYALQGNGTIATTLTDSSGMYLINNLPAGNYSLSLMAAGYQSAIGSVTVTKGQTILLNFVLEPQPGNLTGTVSDVNGPLVGASVQLSVNTTLLSSVLTDSTGGYSISNLAPGQYVLQVSASNHQSVTEGITIVANQTLDVDVNLPLNPGAISGNLSDAVSGLPLAGFVVNVFENGTLIATSATDASGYYLITGLAPRTYSISVDYPTYQTSTLSVTVLAGSTTVADFALQSQPGSISGTVVDTNSLPIANALIEVIQGGNVLATAVTDAQGNYMLTGLAPGNDVVRVTADLFQVALQGVTIEAGAQTITNFTLQSRPGSISGVIQDATTEAPLSGANVLILQGGVQVASALTQSDGSYVINGLPVGSYVVQASASGYQTNQQGIVVTADAVLSVTLSLYADPGSVRGSVVDDSTGGVVSGVSLTLFQGSLFVTSLQTDTSGHYVIDQLAPGEYTLSAAASNYQTATQGVSVSSLSTTTANFRLMSQPGGVRGTVTDQNSNPLPGATITVSSNQILIGSVLTDSSGNYVLNGLSPGNYTLSVSAAGFQWTSQGAIVTANANTNVSFVLSSDTGSINVQVVSGAQAIPGANVQVMQNQSLLSTVLTDANGSAVLSQLAPGTYTVVVSISGYETSVQTVSVASNASTAITFDLAKSPRLLMGIVKDTMSVSIAGATVQLLQGTTVVATTLTAEDGTFSITGLSTGSYTISVNAQNYQIYTAGVSILDQTTNVTIYLMGNPGSVTGNITDGMTGLGLPGILVEVLQGTTVIAFQQTDSNGMYTIDNLPPETYTLRISSVNYQTNLVAFSVQANEITQVDDALNANPSSILGIVMDGDTLNPIANATVNILNQGILVATTTTDINGFYIVANLGSGLYQLNVEAAGYEVQLQATILSADSSVELDFFLSSSVGAVTGTVQDALGQPIAGALVSVYQGATLITTILTDTDGNYLLPNLSPGTYTIVITAVNYQSSTQTMTVPEHATVTANSILDSTPASLTGQVTDSVTLLPIVGAIVQVSNGQTVLATLLTDIQGNFTVNNLSPQSDVVTVSSLNYQTTVQNVNLSAGQTYVMDVSLQYISGSVSGTVLNVANQPISNATVYLLQGSTTITSTLTDALGNYSLSGLAEGNYTVQATALGFQYGTISINAVSGSVLTANFILEPNPGMIQGTITDGVDPLSGAFVQILSGNVSVASTLSDSRGVYSLPNLPPGSYTIQVSLIGYQTNTQGVEVTVGGATIADFVLQVGPSTIFGTVVSNGLIMPLPGTMINSYVNNILAASVLTDSNGQYVIAGLVSGNYTVTASYPNFQTGTLGLFLAPNVSEALNFILLEQPGSVIGVVYNTNQNPLAGATVILMQNNRVIATVTSSTDGSYTLTGLAPGSYTVTASAPTYQTATQGVVVVANQVVALDFNLQPLPSSLSGFVFDSGLSPLAGAQVTIYQNGNLVATSLTGNNGDFSLTSLGSGNYSLVISAPNFQTVTVGIILAAGESLNQNFILSILFGSIQGTVTDMSHVALPNAMISISQSSIVIMTVRADSNGSYIVENLPPGSYVMTCSMPNYQTGVLGAIVSSSAQTIVNFQLATEMGQITGYVTDFNLGTPISAATVTVFSQGTVVAYGVSDTNGYYLIEGLPSGNYIVTVQAVDYQASSQAALVQVSNTTTASFGLVSNPGTIQGSVHSDALPIASAFVSVAVLQGNVMISSVLTDANGDYLITGLQPGNYIIKANATGFQMGVQGVIVVANQTAIANFNLAPEPGTISGSVVDAITTNPISGASVQILQGSVLLISGLTDGNGDFVFPNFAPGNYTLTVSAENYQTTSISVQVLSNQTTVTAVSLQGNPGRVSGIVIDSSSMNPVSGVVIDLLQDFILVATTQTDANGQYVLSQLAPGSYIIRAIAPNYQVSSQGAIVSAGSTLTENISLNILPSTLTGVVIDAVTSQAIAGASVNLLQGSVLIANTLTDVNGNFSLNGLPAGSYFLQVGKPDYQPSLLGETLTSNQTINIPISLQPSSGSIQGTVTNSASQPVIGANIIINILQGNLLVAQTLTDINGFYSISNLGEGSYVIKASSANYQTATAGVIIQPNQVTVVNLTLISGPGSIEGVISDASTSSGIAGVQITVFNGPTSIGSTLTNSSGAYFISGLAPGSYKVFASMNLYQSSFIHVNVTSDATTTANLALQENPGTIAGIITDDQGNLVSGAIINVSVNGLSIATAISSVNGTYQIPGLPPGNYIVTLTNAGYQTFAIGVSVQASQLTSQNMTLLPNPGQILGLVFDENTQAPIANAVIQLLQNNVVIMTALSNAEGQFLFQNLAPGSYTLQISATGLQTLLLSAFVVSNQTTIVDPNLPAEPGTLQGTISNDFSTLLPNISIQVYQNLMFVAGTVTDSAGFYVVTGLASGDYTVIAGGQGFALQTVDTSILSNQTTILNLTLDTLQGTISGRIAESVTGNSIAGASVYLLSGSTLIAVTLTDENGYYAFSSIPAGTYTLRASALGYQTLIDSIVVVNEQNTSANEALQPLPGQLTGQVIDLLTGESLSSVLITVFAGDTTVATTQTDALGNYLITGLAPGIYKIEFRLRLYQVLRESVTIVSNANVLNVALLAFPKDPSEVKQYRIKTEFLTQTEYANRLEWAASTSQSVVAYKIYRDGVFLAQVPSYVLFYEDHNVTKHNHYHYQVAAVNSLGLESNLAGATQAKTQRSVCR